MKRKKDFEFKLKKICLYWYYVHFLRKYSIFLFTQNLVKSDLCMYSELKNNNVECKVVILKDWMLHKFFSNIKQNWEKIRNFECLIGLKNIEDILKTEKILKESKVLIKGYFVQNVFFFFKDWNVKKIEKKNIIENFKQRLKKFYIFLIRIIYLLKKRI